MDLQSTAPPAVESADSGDDRDRLGAEVRESALLLALSLAVTAGVSAVAQALLLVAG